MPEQSATIANMEALKAHVRNGQIVLDDPVELAEGMELEVRPILQHTEDLAPQDPDEFEAAVEESYAQVARGEWVDGYELLDRLKAEAAADEAKG